MKNRTFLLLLFSAACAPSTYVYNFDLTDPGARNLTQPGERDTLEDKDVKTEILVDPTSFQAILLDLTNKTDSPLNIGWDQIQIVGPDRSAMGLHPDTYLGPIQPGSKVVARLVPFVLPSQGSAAEQYDNAVFELVVPMNVRGAQREYRYHLKNKLKKL